MAKQTLASLLGSSDKRKQVNLDLGQQALTPQVQRKGQYTVFAAPTADVRENTATRLANALSSISPAMRQFAATTETQGRLEAATVSPEKAEAELKKMEPGTWLNMARQRGLREGLIKKHFNHTLLPELKTQADTYLDFQKYPDKEKALAGFDSYVSDRWVQMQSELPEGVGNSLEAQVVWSSITGNTRGALSESYDRNLDKFNMSMLSDETHALWRNDTAPTPDGSIDWGGAIRKSADTMFTLGAKSGLTNQDITKRLRTDMLNNATTQLNKGNFTETQELIKQLRFYKRNGQQIFNDAETSALLAGIEKQARDGLNTIANRSRRDVDAENRLNSKRIENFVLNLDEGIHDLNHPDIPKTISLYTNAPVEDVMDYIKSATENGKTSGDALFDALKIFNASDSSEEMRDAFAVVQDSAQDGINRHRMQKPKLTKLEIGQQDATFASYEKALFSQNTSLGPEAYFNTLGKRLTPEQGGRAKEIYERSVVYNNHKASVKDTDDLLLTTIKGMEGTSPKVATAYVNRLMVEDVEPLRRERAKAVMEGDEERIAEIDAEVKTLMRNAENNYRDYQTERLQFNAMEAVKPVKGLSVERRDVFKIKDESGKRAKLKTVQFRYDMSTGVRREFTEEEIMADAKTAMSSTSEDAVGALEVIIHSYDFKLDVAGEDYSERVAMMEKAKVDITDKLVFNDRTDAYEAINSAYLASQALAKGQLDLSDPANAANLKFAQLNGIESVEDAEDLLRIVADQLQNKND